MAAQTVPTSTGQQPTKTHDLESAANLERVTDFAEEKEITLDVGKAFSAIDKRVESKSQREHEEMQKVIVRKEDVELIVRELEIPKSVAERTLRQHSGDVVKALCELTS
jgi:NACalpha-BTF3-like transcription factor